MKRALTLLGILLLATTFAVAQVGTNKGHSQQETKPRTGDAGNNMQSPDVNAYATGYAGSTLGEASDLNRDGTNAGYGQIEAKPRTGRAEDVMNSPDINAAIGGYRGSTLGSSGDIFSLQDRDVAGGGSPASVSTATVEDRDQMNQQFWANEVAKQAQAPVPAATSREAIAQQAHRGEEPGPDIHPLPASNAQPDTSGVPLNEKLTKNHSNRSPK
jgi:hypothetical protein